MLSAFHETYGSSCKRQFTASVIVFLSLALLSAQTPSAVGDGNASASKPALEARFEQAAELLDEDRAAGLRRLSELREQAKLALAENPRDARLQFLTGEICFLLDNDDAALRHYDQAIALDPRRLEAHFQRGVALRYKSDPAAAAQAFQTVVEMDPRHARGWYELGQARSDMKNAAGALEAYEKAGALLPDQAQVHLAMGGALIDLDRREDAIKAYQRATAIDPEEPDAFYNLGQTAQDLDRFAEALAAFRRVTQLSPDDYRACAKVIQCCEAVGQTELRDRERERLLKLFTAGKCQGKTLYCRDQFAADDKWVMVLEYFEMDLTGKDERPIRYSFLVNKSRSDLKSPLYRITLGSYPVTTEHGRVIGKLGKDERYWHIDRYYPNESHETFAFFNREPSYDEVKRFVVDVLQGKRNATSSMTPTSQGAAIKVTP